MNRIIALAVFAAVSLPALAAACSPAWSGEARVAGTDAPECLLFEGQRTTDGAGFDVRFVVINDCEADAVVGCPDDAWCDDGGAGAGAAEFEVRAGDMLSLVVRAHGSAAGPSPIVWRLGEQSGTVDYAIVDSAWGGCGPPPGCNAAPGSNGAPGWLGLALLALLGLRRLR